MANEGKGYSMGENGAEGRDGELHNGEDASGYTPPSNGGSKERKSRKPLDPKAKKVAIIVALIIVAVAVVYGIAYCVTDGFHQHTWTDATCTEPKTCSECGAVEGEPLDHDYAATEHEATCTKGSYTVYVCNRCNDVREEPGSNPALGHDPGEWSFDSATQKEVRKCRRCGSAVESRDITKESLATALDGWKATLDECFKRESNSQYKYLYRDQACVTVTNRADKAIRSAVVYVCAWDESGNPVKIGYVTTDDVYALNCSDMNIQPGESWSCEEQGVGFDLNGTATMNIAKISGVIKSVTYLDGTSESNPYADAWLSLYKGKVN